MESGPRKQTIHSDLPFLKLGSRACAQKTRATTAVMIWISWMASELSEISWGNAPSSTCERSVITPGLRSPKRVVDIGLYGTPKPASERAGRIDLRVTAAKKLKRRSAKGCPCLVLRLMVHGLGLLSITSKLSVSLYVAS